MHCCPLSEDDETDVRYVAAYAASVSFHAAAAASCSARKKLVLLSTADSKSVSDVHCLASLLLVGAAAAVTVTVTAATVAGASRRRAKGRTAIGMLSRGRMCPLDSGYRRRRLENHLQMSSQQRGRQRRRRAPWPTYVLVIAA